MIRMTRWSVSIQSSLTPPYGTLLAQSENTRRNYAGQFRKFHDWCEHEEQSALPAQPEVVAAYAAELAEDGKSMSTIRLAVAAIVDAHRSVGLESPQTTGVTETLRGLSRQVGVSQKQARPLDADALAAIKATALNPRKSRGGSLEMEETALRRGRHDIALASVLSDAGLRISEATSLRWRDVLDAENGAGLVYIERSKTDQAGDGAYVVVTPDTLAALKQLREDSEAWTDDEPVFGLRCLRLVGALTAWREPRDWVRGTRVIRAAWAWPLG